MNGSEIQDNGRLRTPVVSIIVTNRRVDPLALRFVAGNFAHGDTILRVRLDLEIESPPEITRRPVISSFLLVWPLRATTLQMKDGPDLGDILASEGYSPGELFGRKDRRTTLWLTMKPDVFAPFTSLPIWPEVRLDDPDLFRYGEFVSKRPFQFRLDSDSLAWCYMPHSKLIFPIAC